MTDVIEARMTHDYDGDLVLFLIGMRINRWWRLDLWLPVFLAMPAMLAELSKDKDSGLLGYRLTFGAGGPLLVQYWCSHEKLYRYASDRMLPTVRPGPRSTAGHARLQVQLAFGMRPISSSGPSRFTPECLFQGWPRLRPPFPSRGAAKPRQSGSVRDRPPRPRVPGRCPNHPGEKWSYGRFAQR